jgi:hypothetical protein
MLTEHAPNNEPIKKVNQQFTFVTHWGHKADWGEDCTVAPA